MVLPLVEVVHGGALKELRKLPAASVDAVITDPPYELGFMGKSWDTAGIAYSVELWAECLRVLRPGGHLAAFGGSRTYHRMACAVEDAGFEIRDSLTWLYGSGFPKSLDVSKAIDKRPGVERHPEFAADLRAAMASKGYTNTFDVAEKVVGRRTGAVANWQKYQFPEAKWWPALRDLLDMDEAKWGPVIAEAERKRVGVKSSGLDKGSGDTVAFLGSNGRNADGLIDVTAPATDAARTWQGWGTALKPAQEPIVLARKPLQGTVAANTLAHGVGGLNIDATRVATDEVITNHARGVVSAISKGIYGDSAAQETHQTAGQTQGRWPANVLLTHSPECDGVCVAGCPVAELDTQSGITTTALRRGDYDTSKAWFGGGKANPGNTHGDTGGASRFFPTFRYQAKAPTSERPKVDGVAHPTVKPLALMRWLVRLLCPPGGTVLEPFAGSGTTVEACIDEGMSVIGIEREAEYLPHIQVRIDRARARQTPPLAGDSLALFEVG